MRLQTRRTNFVSHFLFSPTFSEIQLLSSIVLQLGNAICFYKKIICILVLIIKELVIFSWQLNHLKSKDKNCEKELKLRL